MYVCVYIYIPFPCLSLPNKLLAFDFLPWGFLLGKSNQDMDVTLDSFKEWIAQMLFKPVGL